MSWTLCTSGSAIIKAGEDADTTLTGYTGASKTAMDQFSDEAEALVCSTARSNIITNYTSLTANGKKIIDDICSSYIAQQIIRYKISSYQSRAEATTMLNVLENTIQRNLKMLADDSIKTFLGIST